MISLSHAYQFRGPTSIPLHLIIRYPSILAFITYLDYWNGHRLWINKSLIILL